MAHEHDRQHDHAGLSGSHGPDGRPSMRIVPVAGRTGIGMGFMDEVAKFGAEDKKCPVARFLGTEKAKGITEELLKQAVTTYGPKSPWLAMRQRGYDGSQESVSKHARGVCSCLRTS